MNRQRIVIGSLGGAILGAATAAIDIIGIGLASVVSGIVVGLLATSDLDETPAEGLIAGGLTAVLLYLGGLGYLVLTFDGSLPLANVLFVFGSYGYYAAVFALPVFAVFGFLGSVVGRRIGRRARLVSPS